MGLTEEEKPVTPTSYLDTEQSPSDEVDTEFRGDYYYRSYKKTSDPIPIGWVPLCIFNFDNKFSHFQFNFFEN